MGPRQLEDAIGKIPVLIFSGQAQGCIARGANA